MEIWTPDIPFLSSSRPAVPDQWSGTMPEAQGSRQGCVSGLRPAAEDDKFLLKAAREHLTTAELLYGFPDYPLILQTYVWQDYDLAPRYPVLSRFIHFWQREIDAHLHRVTITQRETTGEAQFTFYAAEF